MVYTLAFRVPYPTDILAISDKECAGPMIDQLFEFVQNHPLLVGAFLMVLTAWIIYEVRNSAASGVTSTQATQLINREDAVVVDTREAGDFKAGHIAGAFVDSVVTACGCSPAVLGSFGESSLASRRKRGPVAFRPRLSAGLAIVVTTNHSRKLPDCTIVNKNGTYTGS